MAIFQDSIINELKMRLALLEKQNEQHAYLMQEKLLFWLVGESLKDPQNQQELLEDFLERITELLDIPIGIVYHVTGTSLKQMAAYCLQDKRPTTKYTIQLTPELLNQSLISPQIISNKSTSFNQITFLEGFITEPRLVSIFPMSGVGVSSALIIFIEEEKEKDSISAVKLMILQLITLLENKLDNIYLTQELESVKNRFESHLQLKERELKAKYSSESHPPTSRKSTNKNQSNSKNKEEPISESSIELLKNIGVEIRTPLNGIQGFAEIIREEGLTSEEKNNFIDIIKSCGNSMLKSIDDAITYSVIKSENLQLTIDKFDLTSFMSELYDEFKNNELFRQRKDLDLRLNINVNGIRQINTDAQKLKQIFSNLIGNSIKFTSEGIIEIGCNILSNKGVPDELLFYVKDTGVGIDKEVAENVYDEFFKVEHEISKLYGGIGLGLSITKKLVEMLEGRIWFESEKNVGTQFNFILPISVLDIADNKNLNGSEKFNLGYNWDGFKLMIVEDDIMSYVFLKEILRPTKINILHAADGIKAIEMVSKNVDIDLILMDIKLPGISGYEATKKIKEIRDIPVIAQTAYAMSDDHSKILEAGCDDYISKPINRKNLLRKIEKYLEESSDSEMD